MTPLYIKLNYKICPPRYPDVPASENQPAGAYFQGQVSLVIKIYLEIFNFFSNLIERSWEPFSRLRAAKTGYESQRCHVFKVTFSNSSRSTNLIYTDIF